jgi:hypothetical protein
LCVCVVACDSFEFWLDLGEPIISIKISLLSEEEEELPVIFIESDVVYLQFDIQLCITGIVKRYGSICKVLIPRGINLPRVILVV